MCHMALEKPLTYTYCNKNVYTLYLLVSNFATLTIIGKISSKMFTLDVFSSLHSPYCIHTLREVQTYTDNTILRGQT